MRTLRLIGGACHGRAVQLSPGQQDITLTVAESLPGDEVTYRRVTYTERVLRQDRDEISYMAPQDMTDLDAFRFLLMRDDILARSGGAG